MGQIVFTSRTCAEIGVSPDEMMALVNREHPGVDVVYIRLEDAPSVNPEGKGPREDPATRLPKARAAAAERMKERADEERSDES